MTENQFLQELNAALKQLPTDERNDILQDIKEYFANAQADGKSDSEIAGELGSPQNIAKDLVDSYDFTQSDPSALDIELTENKFDQIDIQTDSGILFISPSDDGRMHTEATDKSYRHQLFVDILDRTLVITLKEEPRKWGIFSAIGTMKSPTLTVQLPDKLYKKMLIASEHGRIALSHINATDCSVQSENGDIELKAIQAQKLRIKTENGKLKLQKIQTGELNAVSRNGAILMTEVEGDVQAKTDNGRIHLLAADLDRNIGLETANGSILLETWKQPNNTTIRTEVGWGMVSVFGLKNRKSVFGNGDHTIDLHSDNGSITVQMAD